MFQKQSKKMLEILEFVDTKDGKQVPEQQVQVKPTALCSHKIGNM